jgi:hypothetical protein
MDCDDQKAKAIPAAHRARQARLRAILRRDFAKRAR